MASARAAALWLVAAIGFVVLEAVAAAGFQPGYSYAHNYISDLGVPVSTLAYSPRADLMQAAFYLQGILFFLGAALLVGLPDSPRGRLFLGTVAANAVGNIVIGSVHSGTLHVAGAVLAILAGNVAILTGAAAIEVLADRRWYRGVSKLVGSLGLLSMTMFMVNAMTATTHLLPDAVWERGSVYSITFWQLFTAACLLTTRRRQSE